MSPAASRYAVTTRDPGASEVLTVGPTDSPRAIAFRASSPAPTMTVGLDVFVHDVIAAIATDPVRISADVPPTVTVVAGYAAFSSLVVAPGSPEERSGRARPGESVAPSVANDGGSEAGNESAEASSTTPLPGTGGRSARSPVGRS